MITKEGILDFIKHFQNEGTKEVFLGECSYWFAFILKERFYGEIAYDSLEKHFVALIDRVFYDITGVYNRAGILYRWEDYKSLDPLDAIRVWNDYILKLDNNG